MNLKAWRAVLLVGAMSWANSGSAQQPRGAPPNDTCGSAIDATVGSGTTIGATLDGAPDCTVSQTAPGVWYSLIGSGGEVTVGTCGAGTDFDTRISVYCAGCDDLHCVAGDEDGGCGSTSEATWCGQQNVEYLVLVHGAGVQVGHFDLTVSHGPSCTPSIACNDSCGDLAPATDGSTAVTTLGATTDGPAEPECEFPFGDDQIYNDVWFCYEATCSGIAAVEACGADYDSRLAVYDGCVCPEAAGAGACDDDGCDLQSRVAVNVVQGNQYAIRLGGFSDTDFGSGPLVVNCLTNDDCDRATELTVPSGGSDARAGSTFGTGVDAAPACGSAGAPTADGVWYSVTGTGNTLAATTCDPATSFDTQLSVFCSDCGTLECVAGNDDTPGPFDPACDSLGIGANRASTVEWCSRAGGRYLILVHGFGADSGTFGLEVSDDGTVCTGGVECAVTCPFPCFDLDGDAAVNLFDFGLFAACYRTDPSASQPCTCADFNGDQSIDLFDFGMFANHFLIGSAAYPPNCPVSP